MPESLVFSNPHEELSYLRNKVLEAERKLESAGQVPDRKRIVSESIHSLKGSLPNLPETKLGEAQAHAESLLGTSKEVELRQMADVTAEKGVIHALAVVEKLGGWRLEDDFHGFLVEHVAQGLPVAGLKEKGPLYQALHMTLYEVLLPKSPSQEKSLAELAKSMEQLYAGLLSLTSEGDEPGYLAFELANPEGEEDTHIFVSVPNSKSRLFERQLLSIYPDAKLLPREHDYNIFSDTSFSLGASARLAAHPAYPLKTSEEFGGDPLNVILSGFAKLPAQGAGAALQIIFKPAGESYTKKYQRALAEIKKGKKPSEVLKDESVSGEIVKAFGELFGSNKKKDPSEAPTVDDRAVESVGKKLESPIVETNMRLVVSAPTESEAKNLMLNLKSAFNQFENAGVQSFRWQDALIKNLGRRKDGDFYRAFTFRLFRAAEALPLNTRELSTLMHFHTEALSTSTPLKKSASRSAPPPVGLSESGTLLGVNRHQGQEKKIYISDEDRLRHFYTIGQTGTGKSTLLKNMIIEDIRKGNGIAMFDPHGSDLEDVLGNIPPERLEDVIYFDPADTSRPLGLNMLEYDRSRPEEKTFVTNELFSIFQKLYGKVPESMGPMFEQYFRNATMLVIEDPESGSTLVDVSRVLSDRNYRALKLARCKNPIVVQFWREVAEKAGGEAALANIVPYITSKFDVFLANDIMRPIIAQEHSAFDFRQIMDEKKILLVNLSKGRLGEANASLIGLILVGKILMAALSRVDSLGSDLPPFYLYLDEFQSITTSSTATILSEARKYKLSLTLAHQFIAQLDVATRDAVFGNVGTLCAFRVGADDAKYLESQFAPVFSADDLLNVDNHKAHLRLLSGGRPVAPFDIETVPSPKGDPSVSATVKALSRERYGRDREEVEAEVMAKYLPAGKQA